MDIKLKKLRNSNGTKVLAFLLCISFCIGMGMAGLQTLLSLERTMKGYSFSPVDLLMADHYTQSECAQWQVHSKTWDIKNQLEQIVHQNSNDEVNAEMDSRFESWFRTYLEEHYRYFLLDGVTEQKKQLFLESLYDNVPRVTGVIDEAAAKAAFEEEYAGQIEDAKRQTLDTHKKTESVLNHTEGFFYYASKGSQVITNLKDPSISPEIAKATISRLPIYQLTENNTVVYYPDRTASSGEMPVTEAFSSNEADPMTIYMGFDQAYVQDGDLALTHASKVFRNGFLVGGLCLLGVLITLCYLIVSCGKRDEEGKWIRKGAGRWFTDVHVLLLACGIGITVGITLVFIDQYGSYYGSYQRETLDWLFLSLWGVGVALCLSLSLGAFLELIKKIKEKRLFKDMILIRLMRSLWQFVKSVYNGTTVVKKAVIIAAVVCIGSATVFFFPVMLIGTIYIAVRYAKMLDEVKNGVKIVKNGNPEHKIETKALAGELLYLAEDINELSHGFDDAVKQELKNQRMKTELISNVSHDIKTPLTSIITYVDLLKKEGLDCEDAPKYLDILDQKSIRLQKLTEDLFEAAKASSGDIPVHLEPVDILSLINQGLGELNIKLEERQLDVILKTAENHYHVLGDGQLLWRVVENILGNVIKYASESSRVYIDVTKEVDEAGNPFAKVEVKNMSKNPLNIPEGELMERFTRGDESRNTEGSGLGLSIAKDLMEIQNGTFYIVIDGDLFKSVFTLPSCE